jgi:hypothetical protein
MDVMEIFIFFFHKNNMMAHNDSNYIKVYKHDWIT